MKVVQEMSSRFHPFRRPLASGDEAAVGSRVGARLSWAAGVVILLVTHLGCRAPQGEPAAVDAAPSPASVNLRWIPIDPIARPPGDVSASTGQQVPGTAFEITKSEVTVAQYGVCVAAGVCDDAHWDACSIFIGQGTAGRWEPGSASTAFRRSDHPVVCVDWAQARTFAGWVGGRLPSAAEWAYAASSGGRVGPYPWGAEAPSCERAVMGETGSAWRGCTRGTTWPVCSKPAGNTHQGLCDMVGNAWEWVVDAGGLSQYRGGGWTTPSDGMRINKSGRHFGPQRRVVHIGFRVAR